MTSDQGALLLGEGPAPPQTLPEGRQSGGWCSGDITLITFFPPPKFIFCPMTKTLFYKNSVGDLLLTKFSIISEIIITNLIYIL